jgi:hypothetical protein
MRARIRWLIFFVFLLLTTCTSGQFNSAKAEIALFDYFNALSTGDYKTADKLYGGEYGILIDMNPIVDPADHITLWKNACQQNGFNCLVILEAKLVKISGNTFIFEVQFQNKTGELFGLGPCCGEDKSIAEPQTVFTYEVIGRSQNSYFILDLPVYTP